ncbi:kinase-like protein [Sodiomyces alkalinus F11]|uniref:non-specific serine/threonine protein kinase n=1 Tax=Sodiomyces alkalinus (strain CBS 110278 / VKM F-3762 / F11) TaxID=1314773 RepID=A0A3N2PZS3_SODAK|nr:kinase-like protein [Sodiomyces alkalinus F11]ROT40014.1 kinase-like protein [Sodiomyces alkalinus F11]
MTSRTAVTSPVPIASRSDVPSSPDRLNNIMPPVAPPRTSSNNYNTSSGTSVSKRREYTGEPSTASPRRGDHETLRPDMNGSNAAYTEASASRSRRSHQHAPMTQGSPHGTSSPRDGRGGGEMGLPIRSHDAASHVASSSPRQPSREASEVLTKLVVSQPEIDIQRERERMTEAQPRASLDEAAPPPVVPLSERDDNRRGARHHAGRRDKVVKFGDYHLGNTIGEGEFGKVKLGWKQDSDIQVAIKLIKRDTVGSNPSRLAKIYREIAILRGIQHPNIVRLHEMVETERHIGIILEYASGGELFDYILTHRYLKDNAARRLFAQLVSGVGYLHKKGIVHRDLKLENLLLDRNRNIIITDFGFANTFDADEELSQEEELNLTDREFVKRMGLDKLKRNGTRKGDLMQTSCGSPCYAAPELVVSDSLYTGRKVDVWSCGVILYAMLAGYLPFDDDPANPEGDNINLLYKYIVNTPLTFPEYVTPHSRDLLRRILVPNPRKRADLFEVARHSWLSEYAHVVEFITSSTTTPTEIQNTTVPAEDERPMVARSASVREASRTKAVSPTAVVGGLASKQGTVDPEAEAAARKDSKRRTVQVEYVAPTTQTQRGDGLIATATTPTTQSPGRGKSRARSNSQGPVEVESPKDKPLPKDPPVSKETYSKTARQNTRPPSSYRNAGAPGRPGTRSTSDNVYMSSGAGQTGPRPQTGGSMGSVGSMGLGGGSRPSYGQPIPPSVAGTNAHGSIQQPNDTMGHPSVSANPMPPKFARVAGYQPGQQGGGGYRPSPPVEGRGHRRSSTLTDLGSKLLGRNASMFSGKSKRRSEMPGEDRSRKYPPVSMSLQGGGESRQSIDSRASRRSFSIGFNKKRSGSITPSHASQEKQTRRFSLLPPSLSRAMGFGKDSEVPHPDTPSQQNLPIQDPPELDERGRYFDGASQSMGQTAYYDGGDLDTPGYQPNRPPSNSAPALQQRQGSSHMNKPPTAIPSHMQQGAVLNTGSESSLENPRHGRQGNIPYQAGGFSESDGYDGRRIGAKGQRGTLQKNKRFTDAYEQDDYHNGHEGSSGAAKRVMDFFRRRGRARGGEER